MTSYLLDCLSLGVSAHLTRLERVRTPSLKFCHLVEPQKDKYSVAIMGFWNSLQPEIERASTLLVFQKAKKTWLFPQAFS